MAKAPDWLDDDIKEFYNPDDVNIRAIESAIKARRGKDQTPPYMTIVEHMKRLGLARPRDKKKKAKEATLSTNQTEAVEVLPGHLLIETADTPAAEVHYGAVHEFDRLPDGYAKVIQPMRPYSDAEEWALNKSMEIYGFIGAIVRDQYGRILDGNQRERVARLRGLGVPDTISHVRDDAHAMEIARAANAVRRHYTPEQRQELAPILRDQGFSYCAIADALGVGVATVYRDVFGVLKERPEAVDHEERVPNGTPEVVTHPNETVMHTSDVPNGTPETVMTSDVSTDVTTTDAPVLQSTPDPVKRVKGRDKKSYPAQRPNGTKAPPLATSDKQRMHIVGYLMQHALNWDDKDWQSFVEVVERVTSMRQGQRDRAATE